MDAADALVACPIGEVGAVDDGRVGGADEGYGQSTRSHDLK
jgi:hypothetical protein